MADLFSCPFCGGSDVSPSSFDVKCMECGVEMPGGTERAIAAWNRRAPSPDMREAVEALEAVLSEVEETERGNTRNPGTDYRCRRWFVNHARSLTGAKP